MPALKSAKKSSLKKEPEAQKVAVVREPLKELLSWEAPAWLFKKRDREYFTTIGAIVFLLILILFFLQEWALIILIIALTFLAYLLATKEPGKVTYQITNRGLMIGGKNYKWEDLGRFWFGEKWDQKILYVEHPAGLPGQLVVLLGPNKPEEIEKILSSYLLFEEPEKTWTDKAGEWLSSRVPLEKN